MPLRTPALPPPTPTAMPIAPSVTLSLSTPPASTPRDPPLATSLCNAQLEHVVAVADNHRLREELRHLQHALATVYTPGHDALKADFERADARARIADADIRAAGAAEATARAELCVVRARLEGEVTRTAGIVRRWGVDRREIERLRKEVDVMGGRERELRERIDDMEIAAREARGRVAEMESALVEREKVVKEMERELKKSVAAGNRRTAHVNAMKRAVETARAASKVLREKLIKERASRKESEKEWQERMEAELARASDQARSKEEEWQMRIAAERSRLKCLEEERDEWKRRAAMTDRQLGTKDDSKVQSEEVGSAFVLPPASALMDGNNAALLSPAPLAGIGKLVPTSPASESRSRFTSLPFASDNECANGDKTREGNEGTRIVESSSKVGGPMKSSRAAKWRTGKEGARGKARPRKRKAGAKHGPTAEMDTQGMEVTSTKHWDVSEDAEQPSASKRRKVEKGRGKSGGTKTEKTAGRQRQQCTPNKSEVVERKAGERRLRSRRRISYDYNRAGRDIVSS